MNWNILYIGASCGILALFLFERHIWTLKRSAGNESGYISFIFRFIPSFFVHSRMGHFSLWSYLLPMPGIRHDWLWQSNLYRHAGAGMYCIAPTGTEFIHVRDVFYRAVQ